MIQLRTVLKPADNSGAKSLMVVHIHGGSKRRFAAIGDVVSCVVNQADPNGQVKDSEVVKALIVRTRKELPRKDGSYIRFDDNAAVVLESVKSKEPRATRIFGPIAREIKELGYNKIASLAKEVL
jgi:large subunit ribosomal protein L14